MSPLLIAPVQTILHWEDKKANLAMLEEKILNYTSPVHIMVLPEMFSTGFSMNPEALAEPMDGESIEWMRRVAAQKKVILTGSLIIEEEGSFYNRLIWMLPNGNMGYYNKRHLFAYAGEHEHYSPGSSRFIASVNGWRINFIVCYDLRFPVWARQGKKELPEFDVLICVANWPARRSLAWNTLLRARAIENQCYVVGVNRVGKDGNDIEYCGDSTVIDPLGEILYHKVNEEDIHTIPLSNTKLDEVREKFPFWRDGDQFTIST